MTTLAILAMLLRIALENFFVNNQGFCPRNYGVPGTTESIYSSAIPFGEGNIHDLLFFGGIENQFAVLVNLERPGRQFTSHDIDCAYITVFTICKCIVVIPS